MDKETERVMEGYNEALRELKDALKQTNLDLQENLDRCRYHIARIEELIK